MKRLIIVTSIALGLACVAGASIAQDQSQTTNLQNVSVTAAPGQYETYVVDLSTGYGLAALVGNSHRQYVQAQRAAENSEVLRKQGMAPQPFVSVAIDNSSGPGMARQIRLIDAAQDTVAIVNVYCKQAAPAEGHRCQLVPQSVATHASDQRLASKQAGRPQLAEVEQQH